MMGETEKQKAIRALFPSVAGALARGAAGRAARRAGGGTPGWGWDERGGSCGRCKPLWQHHPRREGERGPVSPPTLVPVFSFAPSKLGVSAVGLGSRNLCSMPARPLSGCSGVPGGPGAAVGCKPAWDRAGSSQHFPKQECEMLWDGLGSSSGVGDLAGPRGSGDGRRRSGAAGSINTVSMATVQQKLFPP